MILWLVIGLFWCVFLATAASGQALDGRREQVTREPSYRGQVANAPIPPEMHQANRHPTIRMWGGCVPSSVVTAARYHGIPEHKIAEFWRIAQERVGVQGTSRELLADMLRQAMPDEPYVDYFGPNSVAALDQLSAKGYAICSTMSWGDPALYGNGRIHHWVNVAHFDSKADLACVVDNNRPGYFSWMTAREMGARSLDGGNAWVFAFTRLPTRIKLLIVGASLLILSAAALLAGGMGAATLSLRSP